MDLTSIAVEIDPSVGGMSRLKLAVALAQQHGARLMGVASDDVVLPTVGGLAGVWVAERRQRDADDLLAALERQFLSAAAGLADKAFRSAYGPPDAFLAQCARAADLVITGRREHDPSSHRLSTDPAALALRAGRPVLMIPHGVERLSGDCIMVAWKDCRESRRAVADAMGFLQRAKSVRVVGVGDETDEAVLVDVEAFLRRHAVNATKEWHPCHPEGAGDTLLAVAEGLEANMIVAGAYGHSRFREWVFGGVTSALIDRATLPCLLSH